MPFASRLGPTIAAAFWASSTAAAYHQWLLREQRREFGRLLVQAREHPGWWNRRLTNRGTRA
jgi:hypothetical protein